MSADSDLSSNTNAVLERLRQTKERQQAQHATPRERPCACDLCISIDEIERLQLEHDLTYENGKADGFLEREELRAENERLLALLDNIDVAHCKTHGRRWQDSCHGCSEAQRLCDETPATPFPPGFVEWVEQWASAYPLDVFPEPDFAKVREALSAVGISLDCVSASNMRHVISRVHEHVRAAERSLETSEQHSLLSMLRSIARHWAEFGYKDGFDELMDSAYNWLQKNDPLTRTAEKTADPYKRCQHDLLKPASTIEVLSPKHARCAVCLEEWRFPEQPADGHHGGTTVEEREKTSAARAPEVCGCPYGNCTCDDGSGVNGDGSKP